MLGAQNLAYDRDKAVADKIAVIDTLTLLGIVGCSFAPFVLLAPSARLKSVLACLVLRLAACSRFFHRLDNLSN
jgi:hypothetical protein